MILLPIFMTAGVFFNGPDSVIHPIDARMNNCLAHSHATMPSATCYNKAYLAWEEDIRVAQNKLLKIAEPQQRKKLAEEESDWEKQRDLEFKKIADKYNNRRGTGYIPVRIELRMEILRMRALELEKRLGQ